MPRFRRALCWFRRDLRTQDHAALYHALKHSAEVIPVFVFDRDILDPLPANDRRVGFIWHSLLELQTALCQMGGVVAGIFVTVGQTVTTGDRLVELEAMKMKVPVMATASGQVNGIKVAVGEAVERGQVLITLA